MDIAVDIFAVCRPGAVAVSGILYWANRTVIGTISVGVFRRALSGELEEFLLSIKNGLSFTPPPC